ncbi:MAG: cupredoxin domain-containing protein [Chloroflexota bacterium]
MGTTDVVQTSAELAVSRLTIAIVGPGHGTHEPRRITQVLESVQGVIRAYFNTDTEMAYVEYRESEVTLSKVLASLEQAGISIGEATVRSDPQGYSVSPALSPPDLEIQDADRNAHYATEFTRDDHSCCGPSTAGGEGIQDAQYGPRANNIQAHSGTVAATAGRGWPFKVRLSVFVAAVVLVLGPALWLVRPMSSNAMGADYSVNMSMTGFTPPSFGIPAGKPVSIELNNVDSPFHGVVNGALHQFAIDKLNIDVRLDGKQSTVINLPPLQPGTYEFYCNVCCGGKVNPAMHGFITVEGAEGVSQR